MLLSESDILARRGLRDAAVPLLPSRVTDGAVFHTSNLGSMLSRECAEVLEDIVHLRHTKVVLCDFDNTLWSGVMAEGPVEHYGERQGLLRELREAGIVLVALSKNSPEAIRWEEMLLTQDDFALLRIGWEQKAVVAEEVCRNLNLSLDSFVFVDDSDVELGLMRSRWPQVTALDSRRSETWRKLSRLLVMPATQQTLEARKRTQLYREAAARRAATGSSTDPAVLLAELNLHVVRANLDEADLPRVVELLARTNQLNTTTRRLSASQLREPRSVGIS